MTQNHYTKANSGKRLLKRFGASSKTGNNQRNPNAMLHEVGRCQQRENTRVVSIITGITTAQVECLCSITAPWKRTGEEVKLRIIFISLVDAITFTTRSIYRTRKNLPLTFWHRSFTLKF
jgi:hypothetical protein